MTTPKFVVGDVILSEKMMITVKDAYFTNDTWVYTDGSLASSTKEHDIKFFLKGGNWNPFNL